MANLTSARFAGDPTLDQVLNGTLRLGAVGTNPTPAPVLSSGPAITKVQQALIDIGFEMPINGADGSFGAERAMPSSCSRKTGICRRGTRS